MKHAVVIAAFALVSGFATAEPMELAFENRLQPVEGAFGVVRLVATEGAYRGCRYAGTLPNIRSQFQAEPVTLMITRRVCSTGAVAKVNLRATIYAPFVALPGDRIQVTPK